MAEQLTLDFPSEANNFCFDKEINQIVKMLDSICMPNKAITKIEKEWSIWSHVPKLGYRLAYYLNLNSELDQRFLKLRQTTML